MNDAMNYETRNLACVALPEIQKKKKEKRKKIHLNFCKDSYFDFARLNSIVNFENKIIRDSGEKGKEEFVSHDRYLRGKIDRG